MDKDFFAERLKYFRSQRGFTQADLAKLTDITAKQISDYEVGRSKPRPATLFKILNALGMDEPSFFDADIFNSTVVKRDNSPLIFTLDSDREIILSRQRFYFDPQHILIHEHRGISMTPTLNDGDLLLVNTDVMRIDYGALYLLDIDRDLTVYRLYTNPNGTITGKRENDDEIFRPITFRIDEIDIVGKVIYRQGFIS